MKYRVAAFPAVVSACVLALAGGGCGAGDAGSADASVAAHDAEAAMAPAATKAAAVAVVSTLKPTLFIERDPDGAVYLRVQEQTFDPFAPGVADRGIVDAKLGPNPGYNNVVEGPLSARISNVDVTQMKYGVTLQDTGLASIYDYTYYKFDGKGGIYGGAIKLGDNGRPTNASTYIQRAVADGAQAPDATYGVSNTDFIGIEQESGPIYIRDVSGKNFGDAGVDTKSTQVYIMNATLSNAHRMLRAWPNVEIIIVNSIVNAPTGHDQAWVYDGTATVRYWNTLWCVNASKPSATDRNCSRTPFAVKGEKVDLTVAQARFIPLTSNPLPAISPFFATQIDQIVVQYSTNSGRTWTNLTLPNTGGPGAAPVGDTRYPITINLNTANYRFRAWYKKAGAKIGANSSVIDEAGAVIP